MLSRNIDGPLACCQSSPISQQLCSFFVAVLLGAAPLLSTYWQDRQDATPLASSTSNPPLLGRKAKAIADAAAQYPYIPQRETPQVFLVTQPGSLPAFGIARRGDAVLVYPEANLAVLYDQQTENIINVIPLPGSGF